MSRFAILFIALLAVAPANAQDLLPIGDPLAPVDAQPAAKQPDVVRQVTECEGEKYVFAWGAGSNPTKVTLCGNKGASHEQNIRMLEDAAAKLERTPSIPEDRRLVLVQQIKGKIAELEHARAADAKSVAATARAAAAQSAPGQALTAARPRPMLVAKPRLTFDCYTPGDLGSGGPCTILGRDTRITVKAGEPLTGASSLRFLRNRQFRAETALREMRKGQSVRLLIPREVCGGVSETEIEIQVTRGGQVADTRGPYLMRC